MQDAAAETTVDVVVVVVGAGVAGSAIAARLARAERSVLVLERDEVYVDRLRGESKPVTGQGLAVVMGATTVLTDPFAAQGVPGRADRVRRMHRCVRGQTELPRALEAVHEGPWRAAEDAFEPSIVTTLALA